MTKTTNTDQAIADVKNMTAAEFVKKYDDRIELLDVDNIMDYNEGVVNLIFRTKREDYILLFIDGQLDTIS